MPKTNLAFYRIKNARDFAAVKLSEFRIVSKSFVLIYSLVNIDQELESFGFAVIASKKVGNAVKRNRGKRLIRALALEISRCFSFVNFSIKAIFIVRAALLARPYHLLIKEAKYCIHKIFEEYEGRSQVKL